jgi:hypothetical protein
VGKIGEGLGSTNDLTENGARPSWPHPGELEARAPGDNLFVDPGEPLLLPMPSPVLQ